MAETVTILRPTSTVENVQNTSLGIGWYPNETAFNDVYTLVNEVVADDQATSIVIWVRPSEDSYTTIGTAFSRQGRIVSAKMHLRHTGSSSIGVNFVFKVLLGVRDEQGNSIGESILYEFAVPETINRNTYTNTTLDVTSVVWLLNQIDAGEITCRYWGKPTTVTSGLLANSFGYLTQTYIELTYDDGETTTVPLYLRENGVWTAVESMVYQKINDVWVEANADILQTEDKYRLITI